MNPPRVFQNFWHFLAFGFGSGLSPKAPGTLGTIAAIPVYLVMVQFNTLTYTAVTVIALLFGIWLCDRVSKDLGVHDHGGIVWDEFVGLWITLWAVPFSWTNLLLGFLLFRFFDVLKPWPINVLDKKIHGGLGIMIDDVLAGVYAWIVLTAIVDYMDGTSALI